jgi:hypothetical protein
VRASDKAARLVGGVIVAALLFGAAWVQTVEAVYFRCDWKWICP